MKEEDAQDQSPVVTCNKTISLEKKNMSDKDKTFPLNIPTTDFTNIEFYTDYDTLLQQQFMPIPP